MQRVKRCFHVCDIDFYPPGLFLPLPAVCSVCQFPRCLEVTHTRTHTHTHHLCNHQHVLSIQSHSHAMYKAGPLPLLPERASVAIHDHMARFEHHDPFIVSQHMGTTKPLPPRSLDMWDFYTSMHLSLKYSSSHILIRMVINVHHQGPAHVGGVHPRQGAWKAKQLFVKRQV